MVTQLYIIEICGKQSRKVKIPAHDASTRHSEPDTRLRSLKSYQAHGLSQPWRYCIRNSFTIMLRPTRALWSALK